MGTMYIATGGEPGLPSNMHVHEYGGDHNTNHYQLH